VPAREPISNGASAMIASEVQQRLSRLGEQLAVIRGYL
jgi:hypothetical protein